MVKITSLMGYAKKSPLPFPAGGKMLYNQSVT